VHPDVDISLPIQDFEVMGFEGVICQVDELAIGRAEKFHGRGSVSLSGRPHATLIDDIKGPGSPSHFTKTTINSRVKTPDFGCSPCPYSLA
jgi:hypothetical protein